MKKILFLLSVTFLLSAALLAEQKTKIYISEIKGPDEFINERFRLLFIEELSKIKTVEVVSSRAAAQFVLEGIGRLDHLQYSEVSGNATGSTAAISGSGGTVSNAMVSVTVTETSTDRVVFVGNNSKMPNQWKRKGATQNAVSDMVGNIKKKLNWK